MQYQGETRERQFSNGFTAFTKTFYGAGNANWLYRDTQENTGKIARLLTDYAVNDVVAAIVIILLAVHQEPMIQKAGKEILK